MGRGDWRSVLVYNSSERILGTFSRNDDHCPSCQSSGTASGGHFPSDMVSWGGGWLKHAVSVAASIHALECSANEFSLHPAGVCLRLFWNCLTIFHECQCITTLLPKEAIIPTEELLIIHVPSVCIPAFPRELKALCKYELQTINNAFDF